MTESSPATSSTVECRPQRDFTVRLGIMTAMLVSFGGWCAYDVATGGHPYKPYAENSSAYMYWLFNAAGQYVFTAAGLIPLILAVRHSRRRLTGDSDGLTLDGRRIHWDKISELDATQLAAKGRLHIDLTDQGTITLKSYHFHNFKDLLALIEKNIPREKVKR